MTEAVRGISGGSGVEFEEVFPTRYNNYSRIDNADITKIYTVAYLTNGNTYAVDAFFYFKINSTLYMTGEWVSSNPYEPTPHGGTTIMAGTTNNTILFVTGETANFINWYNGVILKGERNALSEDFVGRVGSQNMALYSCFVKDTEITMSDGSKKKVQDIDYNDEVMCYDFDNGVMSSGKVFWVAKESIADYYWKITLDDGTTINLVGENGKSHRLFDYDNQRFNYPQDIQGRTLKSDLKTPNIVSCEKINEPVKYYNFKNTHLNCFANDIMCGCRFSNVYEIKDMKYVKVEKENTLTDFEGIPQEYVDGLRLREQNTNLDGVVYYNDFKSHIINCYINKAK